MAAPEPVPAGVIAGIVRGGGGGAPVANARVSFLEGPVPLPDIAALTDPSGSFALAAPAPGTYRISFAAAGFATAAVQATLDANRGVYLEVTLERSPSGRSARGRA